MADLEHALAELRAGPPVVSLTSASTDLSDHLARFGLTARSSEDRHDISLGEGWTTARLNRLLVESGVDVDALVPRHFCLEEFYHDRVSAS